MGVAAGGYRVLFVLGLLALAGCKNDGGSPPPAPPATYSVGGTVSGLSGQVTLANNGGDSRIVSADGAFTFATPLAGGAGYNVTVTGQPANQTCTVAGGGGTIAASNVSSVSVSCVTNTFTVGGSVSGLTGSLTLLNNGGDALVVTASGGFTFAGPVNSGSSYDVTVGVQPADQTCAVSGGTGTASANIAGISVQCVTYRVRATIGAAGGILAHPDGAEVEIPAGALTQATEIAIATPGGGWPLPLAVDTTASGSVYELTPHDVVFEKPVIVRLPKPAGGPDHFVFTSSFNDGWGIAENVDLGSRVELERNSFSWYYIYAPACASSGGPPDPYFCVFPRGQSWVTAVPFGSIAQTSGNADAVLAGTSAVGSAGTWRVDGDILTRLRLWMQYTAAPDCASPRVRVKRIVPGGNPVAQVVVDQPVTLTNGRGVTVVDLNRSEVADGHSLMAYQFACQRPGKSESGGTDFIAFDIEPGPVAGFTVNGSVTGLNSSGLQLQNGKREIIDVPSGFANFSFTTRHAAGASYNVTILSQPANGSCTLARRSGIVTATVTDIAVTCTGTQPQGVGFTVTANSAAGTYTVFERNGSDGTLSQPVSNNLGNVNASPTPVSVVIHPNGHFAYFALTAGNVINGQEILPEMGYATRPLGTVPSTNPSDLQLDVTNGSFLWAANATPGTVSAFEINQQTGVLTAVGAPVATGNSTPMALAQHPNGNFLYAVNQISNSVTTFSIDRATGALTRLGLPLANASLSPSDMLVAPGGNSAYVMSSTGTITRLAVNPTSGALSSPAFTAISGASNGHSLAITPGGGRLFAGSSNSQGSFVNQYTVDPGTGALTFDTSVQLGISGAVRLAVSGDGLRLYASLQTASTVSTFSISGNALSLIDTDSTGSDPLAVATTP